MSQIQLSIVTPVFNRKDLVVRSIYSSLLLIVAGAAKEIIVVDDASTDGGYDRVAEEFSDEVDSGIIKLYRLEENKGVTGAKNFGASQASGKYIAFMDSDDIFIEGAPGKIIDELGTNFETDLFFFRCVDIGTGELIGRASPNYVLTLELLLNEGTPGECLPVVSKKAFALNCYDESLRGCESLAYFNILKSGLAGMVSSKEVRGYTLEGTDRLSSNIGIKRRSAQLIRYNITLLSFFRYMNWRRRVKTFAKILVYSAIFIKWKVLGKR